MKLKKWLALLCAAVLLAALATGCGGTSDKDEDDDKGGEKTTTTTAVGDGDGSGDVGNNNDNNDNNDDQQKEEPVKLLNRGKGNMSLSEGGLYYQENGKYGVMSFDGKYNSGAIYADVEVQGNYFLVQSKELTDENDFAALNSTGMIDGNGKVIIPAEYAVLSELNGSKGRYIKAIKATAITADKDAALVKLSTGFFQTTAIKDGDILYSGTWCIYDTVTGKKVENVGGSKNLYISAYEDYFYFQNESRQDVYVMANGKQITKTSTISILNSNMYLDQSGREVTVYDADGNKLFTETDIDYYTISSGVRGTDLVYAYKRTDDAYTLLVVNRRGEIVVGPVHSEKSSVYAYGELLLVGDQVYRMDGTKVFDKRFEYTNFEYEPNAKIWCGKTADDKYVFFDKDGTILYEGAESDTIDIRGYGDMYVCKEENGEETYYSFKDQTFSLASYPIAPWLHKNDDKLISSLTGQVVLEGYDYYSYAEVVNGDYYIMAKDSNNLWYVYSVVME